MSFPDSLALKNAVAATVTFQRLTSNEQKNNYIDVASALSTPRTFSISHQMTTAQKGVDRHLIKVTKTALDAASQPCTATLNVTLNVPRTGTTRADVDDLIAIAKDFLITANVDKVLRGEV